MIGYLKALKPSGTLHDIANPNPSTFELGDFAHHLARINRWGGATTFTVAQHSCLVADLVYHSQKMQGAGALDRARLALAALWHDGHEAILGDITTGLKAYLRGSTSQLDGLERRWDDAIVRAFFPFDTGFRRPNQIFNVKVIKDADRVALRMEAEGLLGWGAHEWVQTFPTMEDLGERMPGRVAPLNPKDILAPGAAEASFLVRHHYLIRELSS